MDVQPRVRAVPRDLFGGEGWKGRPGGEGGKACRGKGRPSGDPRLLAACHRRSSGEGFGKKKKNQNFEKVPGIISFNVLLSSKLVIEAKPSKKKWRSNMVFFPKRASQREAVKKNAYLWKSSVKSVSSCVRKMRTFELLGALFYPFFSKLFFSLPFGCQQP